VPGFGATEGKKFQLSVGWRYARAHRSYFDSRFNRTFTELWNPFERLSILDVSARYAFTPATSVIVGVPIVINRFSVRLPPLGALGRQEHWHANGLGDISVYAQRWMLDSKNSPFQNFALGVGIKIPSGNWNLKATIPDETGLNPSRRAVYPPAIMPGDGGVGILVGFDSFKTFRRPGILRGVTIFASGNYLINPRNTNGTASIIKNLGVPLAGNFLDELTNSVADTWAMRAGAAIRLPGTWNKPRLKGLRLLGVWHWEGLRSHDLFGRNDGFRQPGWSMAFGPGVTYGYGRDYWILEVPITFAQHINPGRTALPGLPVRTPAGPAPAPFNPKRQMGLVAPVSLSLRYVRTF
jgi:hypothetical protein